MYTPPAFQEQDRQVLFSAIHDCGLANLVTATADGPMATPLPMFLDETEGENGTLYAHLARANPQWKTPVIGDALVVFMGADAYVTPSWYASKAEHGKVVPTWNYVAVHARGPAEFFDDRERLRDVVARLTVKHEGSRAKPWAVGDAPEDFINSQLKGIVGIRIPIITLEGKWKMSQNRNDADRSGVRSGLAASEDGMDRTVSEMVPLSR